MISTPALLKWKGSSQEVQKDEHQMERGQIHTGFSFVHEYGNEVIGLINREDGSFCPGFGLRKRSIDKEAVGAGI